MTIRTRVYDSHTVASVDNGPIRAPRASLGFRVLGFTKNETRPNAVLSQAHDRQIAHDARPLEHEPPAGDAPPGVRFHNRVVVVPVNVRHGADVVGDAERGGHEVRGCVGGGGVVVDVDEEGAELVLVGVVGEGGTEARFDFREAGEVGDGTGAEVGGGGGGEDLVRFWINDVDARVVVEAGEAWVWFEWGPWTDGIRWVRTFESRPKSLESTAIANRLIV